MLQSFKLTRCLLAATAMALLVTVTASAGAPVIDDGGPYTGFAGEPVQFDASATSDPDGDPLTFMWLFPDDFTGATGSQVSHTFATAGTYTPMLTVSDGDGGNIIVSKVTVEVTKKGPEYVGDDTCKLCHPNKYADYMQSGHPYKLVKIGGVEPTTNLWPHSPNPPLPPDGLQWQDVEYVIGNFFWKARFVERDGFIHTGDQVQWNLATQEWVSYHSGETKPYNCGKCHTTGYDPNGNQDDLPGLIGTWTQPGVRCEACHGPGGDHVAATDKKATPPTGGKTCSECHFRDAQFRMPWKNGFMRHHQQGEDFSHSPHRDLLDCVTCHNPHKSVVYDLGGTVTACTDCHAKEDHQINIAGMKNLQCTDCHMAKMGKSATNSNPFKGDVHSHLFRIMTDPVAAADNTYQVDGTTFWNQDAVGNAFITLDYACLGCHADFDPGFTLEKAAEYAKGIHSRQPVGDNWLVKLPLIGAEFNVSFEQFAGIILVTTTVAGTDPTLGVGMEMDSFIFWMDVTGTMYFGNMDRAAGNMNGIVFGPGQTSSIFLGEKK